MSENLGDIGSIVFMVVFLIVMIIVGYIIKNDTDLGGWSYIFSWMILSLGLGVVVGTGMGLYKLYKWNNLRRQTTIYKNE